MVDTSTNAKLEVSFVRILGIQLFWGDYWIIGLDKDYKYAVSELLPGNMDGF